jgi:tetratricopeptide (TPR) repeat protein
MRNNFVAGDDYVIIVENADIRSMASVPKFFTQAYHAMYCPVKMISHAIDYMFSAANPAGYHFFSMLYHIINVALVFVLIFLLVPNAWGAGIAALLFALHPMNAEAAVWLTGRGDLLYAGFYLAGLIVYIRYLRGGLRLQRLWVVFLFFALSALSKASAFTFPLALLALDWFYRRKIFSWRVLLEKAPFFAGALALGISAILLRSEHSMPLSDVLKHFSGIDNFVILIYPLTFYLAKFVFPVNLALPYPHPFASNLPLSWDFYVLPFILPAIGLLIWRNRALRRPLGFAMLFYIAALVSAMRLAPMLGTIAADRYFYVAMTAVVFFVAWLYDYFSTHRGLWRRRAYPVFCMAAAGFIFCLIPMTHTRIGVFRDAITLFGDAHSKYPQHATPLYELTGGYMMSGDVENALRTAEKIIRLLPGDETALGFQTNLYLAAQRYPEALKGINELLRINAIDNYYMTKASIFYNLQQPDSALVTTETLLRKPPDRVDMYNSASELKLECLIAMRRYDDAMRYADSLYTNNPDRQELLMPRGIAQFYLGDTQGGIRDLLVLIEHEPDNVTAIMNLAQMYEAVSRRDEACECYRRAARLGNAQAIEFAKRCQ